MLPIRVSCTLVATALFAVAGLQAEPVPRSPAELKPAHGRPFFMPSAERQRILDLVRGNPWAKTEHERIRAAAEKGDGFWAGFLYALEPNKAHLETARAYLMKNCGPDHYWVREYSRRLADPDHFRGGQQHLADVYYGLGFEPFVVYDWVYHGLAPGDRQTIERGIKTLGRYRSRAMDRWYQTPNLVFKPTFMAAIAGLATQDTELIEWGFFRTQPRGARVGGYFPVLGVMLLDGGPWREAPIYPIAHEDLWCMAIMSRYGGLLNGRDWFDLETPGGNSARGLADYYIDTAYPIEQTGHGRGQIRVASYGDGATSPGGDLFLVNPAGSGLNMEKALAQVHNTTGDPRYAALLKMFDAYQPDLWNYRPLPAKCDLPPAPSKIWPNYGLAMLRSDESPGYWHNEQAIAVFQLMSQGYGHDHRDKFGIMLHGAGRLLYPDYNAIQYESSAIGWTRHSCSHNTLLVDEQDTANADPSGIRHAFSPDVKYLATSASGVFDGVDQTRVLLLTGEYLLDVFQAASRLPHTYDYVLHGLGAGKPTSGNYRPADSMMPRYWVIENKQALTTDGAWSHEFVQRDAPDSRDGNYGPAWYDHTARVRISMAAEPATVVLHGRWGAAYAKLVQERYKDKRTLEPLASLVVRRSGQLQTMFIATHEPYANDERPQVRAVTKLAQTENAVLVRVEGSDFTDYAAAAFGPQADRPIHLLGDGKVSLQFRDYAYVRVSRAGAVTVRGDVLGLRLPAAKGPLLVNGQRAAPDRQNGTLVYLPAVTTAAPSVDPACPLDVQVIPRELRAWTRDRKSLAFSVRNSLRTNVAGRIDFELPEGIRTEPAHPEFGPLAPGQTAKIPVEFLISDPPAGKLTLAYRVVYREGPDGAETRTQAQPLVAYAGPTLEQQFQFPRPPVYRAITSNYSAKMRMSDAAFVYLAGDDDRPRTDGSPLFYIFDDEEEDQLQLLGDEPQKLGVWPGQQPANLVAEAYGRNDNRQARCRWQAIFSVSRITFRMDKDWTDFDRARFVLPGHWKCSGGQPKFGRVIAVDQNGQEREARPTGTETVSAALLEFPDGDYHLAIQFQPPQQVTFNGAAIEFTIGSFNNDQWHLGFCRKEEFDAWRGKR